MGIIKQRRQRRLRKEAAIAARKREVRLWKARGLTRAEVAEALCSAIWGVGDWDFGGPAPRRLLAAVRDLFTTDALEAAAAKARGGQS